MEGIYRIPLQKGSKHFYGCPVKAYTWEPLVMKSEVRKAL
jgi:hypothetical protein